MPDFLGAGHRVVKNEHMATPKLKKVKFLKSPTGSFKLAYHAGDIGQVGGEVLTELLNKGFAELIDGKAETGQSSKTQKAENATNEPKKRPGRPKSKTTN